MSNAYLIPSQVEQVNLLSANEAVFKIQRTPHLNYFTQTVPIPGVNLPPMQIANPHVNVNLEGNKVLYDPLVVTFKLDQDMLNYIELYGWIVGLGKPQSYNDQKVFSGTEKSLDSQKLPKYSDASLFILSNNKVAKIEIRFSKLLPVSLSTVVFTSACTTPSSPSSLPARLRVTSLPLSSSDGPSPLVPVSPLTPLTPSVAA